MILLHTSCKHFTPACAQTSHSISVMPITVFKHLYELFCVGWNEGIDPQDMSDTNILVPNPTKEQNDCHLPLGHHKQTLCAFLQQTVAERFCLESQCGFRAEQAIVDMIFLLRQLHEKCREEKGHRWPYQGLRFGEQRQTVQFAQRIGCRQDFFA